MSETARPTPLEFVRAHGETIAHNLGHHVVRAAQEIHRTLGEAGALPGGVTVNGIVQVVLSLRATLELMAVEQRFGEATHDALLAAMGDYYGRTVLERGRFTTWVAAAHETMRRSDDPRAWLRIHAMNILGTRDPEASIFHTALGYGLTVGDPVVAVVEANTAPG